MFKGRKLAVRPLVEPSLRRNVGFVTVAGRTLPREAGRLMEIVRTTMRKELAAVRP